MGKTRKDLGHMGIRMKGFNVKPIEWLFLGSIQILSWIFAEIFISNTIENEIIFLRITPYISMTMGHHQIR